jgi:hypothetical protein
VSAVFYPLSLIQALDRQRVDMALVDQFDAGSTSSRLRWPAQYFKRRFKLLHSPLTRQEFRYLRSFHSQRTGGYDYFWFRDNARREGNAKVRFSSDLQDNFNGAAFNVQIQLDEVAPMRALPELDEITTAAGTAPLYWHDPNREIYYLHAGTTYAGEANGLLFDPTLAGTYATAWQAGSSLVNLGGILTQGQYLAFDGTGWAKTSSDLSLSTTTPAATIFCLARQSTAAANQALASAGAAGGAIGIGLSSGNTYKLLKNGALVGTGQSNGTPDVWRSLAATYVTASNNANFFANGTQTDTNESTARSYSAGPAVLGALSDGTLISNPANTLVNANVAEVLIFSATLSQAQVKAVHNLFAPLYGMAAV